MATITYPLDVSGLAATNLITGEEHVTSACNAKDYYLIVPKFAPFYAGDFEAVLTDANGTKPLVLGVDCSLALPMTSLSVSLTQTVYGALLVHNTELVGTISIQYRTVGGKDLVDRQYIMQYFAEKIFNPRCINWCQIIGQPLLYPVSAHLQDFMSVFNMEPLIDCVNGLTDTISSGQGVTDIGKHIQNHNNPHQLTALQVHLDQVTNHPVATVDEAKALTAVDHYLTLDSLSALVNEINKFTVMTPPAVDGPDTIYELQTVAIPITNFNSWLDYTITVSSGSFTLGDDGIIHFTAPPVTVPTVNSLPTIGKIVSARHSLVTLTINGVAIGLNINAQVLNAPAIISPLNGAVGQSMDSLTLHGSSFAVTGGNDTQVSADWEIATDEGFTHLSYSSLNDTVNLTSYTVKNLPASTTLYARVRYTGQQTGISNWSPTVSFTIQSYTDVPIQEYAGYQNLAVDVAMSGNGKFAFSANPYSDYEGTAIIPEAGAVFSYNFIDSMGLWNSNEAFLPVNDIFPYSHFGVSVDANADGSLVAVSMVPDTSVAATNDIKGGGKVYTFTRDADNHFHLAGVITTSEWNVSPTAPNASSINAAGYAVGFGTSVALSSNGKILVIGAPNAFTNGDPNQVVGAMSIYGNNGDGTFNYLETIYGPTQDGRFGASVDIDYEGKRIIASTINETFYDDVLSSYNNKVVAHLYDAATLSDEPVTAGQWVKSADVDFLCAADEANVAISGDSNTFIIGSPSAVYDRRIANYQTGAILIFRLVDNVWTQDYKGCMQAFGVIDIDSKVGSAVAISFDGTAAMVGARQGIYNGAGYWSDQSAVVKTGSVISMRRVQNYDGSMIWHEYQPFTSSSYFDNVGNNGGFGTAIDMSWYGEFGITCTGKNQNPTYLPEVIFEVPGTVAN